jgi:hypothetical protein
MKRRTFIKKSAVTFGSSIIFRDLVWAKETASCLPFLSAYFPSNPADTDRWCWSADASEGPCHIMCTPSGLTDTVDCGKFTVGDTFCETPNNHDCTDKMPLPSDCVALLGDTVGGCNRVVQCANVTAALKTIAKEVGIHLLTHSQAVAAFGAGSAIIGSLTANFAMCEAPAGQCFTDT